MIRERETTRRKPSHTGGGSFPGTGLADCLYEGRASMVLTSDQGPRRVLLFSDQSIEEIISQLSKN